MLEVRDLELVEAITTHGSLARASRVLGVSQPALTRHVAALEQRLGSVLFTRSSQGVEQTDLCRALMAAAGDLLARFRSLSTRLRHTRSHHETEVAVVAGTIAAETVGMAALGLMLRARQNVQIRFTALNWLHALSYLRDRTAELAIFEISECGDEPDLIVEPLHRHPGGFAVRSGHPLAGKSGVTLADVLCYPMCFLGRLPDRVIQQFVSAREAAQCSGGAYPVFPASIVESPTTALLAACNSDAVIPVTGSLARAWLRSDEIVLLPWHEPWLTTNLGSSICAPARPLLRPWHLLNVSARRTRTRGRMTTCCSAPSPLHHRLGNWRNPANKSGEVRHPATLCRVPPPLPFRRRRRSSPLVFCPADYAGCGCSPSGGRLRRSAMNWSNSALSLAKRRRSRKVANSCCSSSRRRRVSARYSSKARLPLDCAGRSPPHQLRHHCAP